MAGGGGVLLLAQLTNNQAPIEMCRGRGPNSSKTTLWEINVIKLWVAVQLV